jgi:hypothetical protein
MGYVEGGVAVRLKVVREGDPEPPGRLVVRDVPGSTAQVTGEPEVGVLGKVHGV